MTRIEAYRSHDGKIFENLTDCEMYEARIQKLNFIRENVLVFDDENIITQDWDEGMIIINLQYIPEEYFDPEVFFRSRIL